MASRRKLQLAVLLMSITGVWATWAWIAEIRATLVGAATGPALLQAVTDPAGLPTPGSLRGQASVAEACERLLGGTIMAFQPAEVRTAAASSCLDSALAMEVRAPALAVPRLLKAQAASDAGKAELLPAALLRAWAAAPSTGWLAERRVVLALGHASELDDPAREALEHDVLLLARTLRGATVLADLYLTAPDIRDLLVSVVEQGPPEDQRRFLSSVRDAGG